MRALAVAVVLLLTALPVRAQDAGAAPQHPVDRAAELLERVVPHVEAACGVPFPKPPTVAVLTPRAAERVFREDARDDVARRYPRATDGQRRALLSAAARTSVASCVARYSFAIKRIVVVRESFDAQRAAAGFSEEQAEGLLLAVLAHEAVHALDDAHHDLRTFYWEAPGEEGLRARAMVAEGRAVVLGRRAAEAAGAPEKARELLPGGDAPRDLHAWLLRLTYAGGAEFVRSLASRDDAPSAAELFATPPRSTHTLFHPESWPSEEPDERPARVFAAADLDGEIRPLSELQLRARYASLHDAETARTLFAGFRGGAQSLQESTNVAVLAFGNDEAAARYVAIAGEEAPTERHGSLVLRAFGPAATTLLPRLRALLVTVTGD